jgi:hypothetical protein
MDKSIDLMKGFIEDKAEYEAEHAYKKSGRKKQRVPINIPIQHVPKKHVIRGTFPEPSPVGEGIFTPIQNFAQTLLQGRSDYPQDQKNIISQYGQNTIKSIQIGRTPLSTLLNTTFNVLTLGVFKKRLKNEPYDKLYHLFILILLDNNKTILLEKNAAINMKVNPQQPPPTTTYMDVNQVPSSITFGSLLSNTQKLMGDKYWIYDGLKNNCQDFIISIFKANSILTPSIQDFVKQNVSKLFENLNNTRKFMNTFTKIGEKVDIISKGGRLNRTPVLKEYADITNHLISHITDIHEPIDKKDVKDTKKLIDKISQIKGGSIIQSIVFKKPKWTIDKCIEWLKAHGYVHEKIDEMTNTYRFRQLEPIKNAKYRMKAIGKNGIFLNLVI